MNLYANNLGWKNLSKVVLLSLIFFTIILSLRHLAIEPEFVFRLGRDVTKEFLDNGEIEDAIETIAPGIELHNYKFWFEPTS